MVLLTVALVFSDIITKENVETDAQIGAPYVLGSIHGVDLFHLGQPLTNSYMLLTLYDDIWVPRDQWVTDFMLLVNAPSWLTVGAITRESDTVMKFELVGTPNSCHDVVNMDGGSPIWGSAWTRSAP